MKRANQAGLTTQALHAGYEPDTANGAVVPPLHLTTTFVAGNTGGYEYSRSGNPTRQVLERTLAALDDATFALAYSSGSAVLANIVALLSAGEKILFSADAYGGTYRYIVQVHGAKGGAYAVVDFTDVSAVEAVLQHGDIKIVWVETPSNPLLKVVDIAVLASLAHQYGAILAVDNTFATPVIQRPLRLGADIVVYSTTKYMNGHSDSVGGSLALRDPALHERLKFLQNAMGAILSPFDSWLTLRGLRTLELRMERQVANARKLAAVFKESSKVQELYYPAYFTGEQYNIATRQMALPGAILSIVLDEHYEVRQFLEALRYFPLAESLGAVESLIDHPATMTHAAIPTEERRKIGLSDGLLRLSVGAENPEDLVRDVKHALAATLRKR